MVLDGGWNRVSLGEDADVSAPTVLRGNEPCAADPDPGTPFLARTRIPKSLTGIARRCCTAPGVLSHSRRRRRNSAVTAISTAQPGRTSFLATQGTGIPTTPCTAPLPRFPRAIHCSCGAERGKWELLDSQRHSRRTASRQFRSPGGNTVHFCQRLGHRYLEKREYSEPQYQKRHLKCDTWEVVVPELVFEPNS